MKKIKYSPFKVSDDVLSEIFKFYTQKHLFLKIAPVCKRFRWVCLSKITSSKFFNLDPIKRAELIHKNEINKRKCSCKDVIKCTGGTHLYGAECMSDYNVCCEICDVRKYCNSCSGDDVCCDWCFDYNLENLSCPEECDVCGDDFCTNDQNPNRWPCGKKCPIMGCKFKICNFCHMIRASFRCPEHDGPKIEGYQKKIEESSSSDSDSDSDCSDSDSD